MARLIGLFGGTFDPPHLGHLILADEARFQLNLERVLWILTPNPPHKKNQALTSVEQRLEMVAAALATNPAFEICRVDVDRPPPHYAVDTVRLLAKVYPDARLVYLMGSDSLRDLPSWHQPDQFLAVCDALGVMLRPGVEYDLSALEQRLAGITSKLRFVDGPLIEISSSQIRQRIARGLPYRYLLPPAVYDLIHTRRMYL